MNFDQDSLNNNPKLETLANKNDFHKVTNDEELTESSVENIQQKKKLKLFLEKNKNVFLIILGLMIIFISFKFLMMGTADQNKIEDSKKIEEPIEVTPTPKVTEIPQNDSILVPSPTSYSKIIPPTKTPTSTPIPTPTIKIIPPPATPTPIPEPLVMRISFPTEGQVFQYAPDQTQLCVVDVPVSGSHSGMQIKRNINGGGWSDYESYQTYCYDPPEGANSFQSQYKNDLGQETGVYSVNYTLEKP